MGQRQSRNAHQSLFGLVWLGLESQRNYAARTRTSTHKADSARVTQIFKIFSLIFLSVLSFIVPFYNWFFLSFQALLSSTVLGTSIFSFRYLANA
jgi:hypothetical protein